ncbi:MAG: DUF4159 domain-containing protein [Phycisphaerales bacterium]
MALLTALGALTVTATQAQQPSPDDLEPRVKVAHLVYAGGKSSVCFSSGYLDLLDRETDIPIDREPARIEVISRSMYEYPFTVMTGEGAFELDDDEVNALREYLERGGFILASAGCSNANWDTSFRREILRVAPDGDGLRAIDLDHDLFRMVFNVTYFQSRGRGEDVRLYGLYIDDRLALVYSPEGLNDTGNAGGGCCCCGGVEIRNAKYINANILAWALTQ